MKFVNVTGYLSTGSSAVVDYIREFENTAVCKTEIRFIRDPFGIIDLDTALTYNWENERASYAIWNFLDRSKKWARYNRHFWSPVGHSYKAFLNKNYYKITEEYVNNLTDYRARFSHYCDEYNLNYFSYVINRIRRNLEKKSLGKYKLANRRLRQNYFAHPSDELFVSETKKYIERLFSDISNNNQNLIILDQALPPDNLNYTNRYFNNCVNIIIDRDPRDTYVENVFLMDVVSRDIGSRESGVKFVKHFKALHDHKQFGDSKVLELRFEDVVLKYEETTKIINKFLGLDESKHVYPLQYFNPSKSSKNIGKYKLFYDKVKDAIDYIYQELKEYCFEK